MTLLLALMPSESVEANRQSTTVELPLVREPAAPLPEIAADPEREITPEAALVWREETIRSGDNLTTLFKRVNLSAADVYAVANANAEADALKRLRPGETLAIALDNEGRLAGVRYIRSPLESYEYLATHQGFTGKHITREPEMVPTYRTGNIETSLFLDAEKAGLSHGLIMAMANIFGWDIDFALDIRRGDSFSVLYEEAYLDGEKIGAGDILAAEFSNQGKTFKAVRFREPDSKINYYTPEGLPMRKAFLRAPVDFTRISSNFNPRRLHPIFKTVRPHRGIDYAAPRGTPIYAAGDGKVVKSGYSTPNGNYVFIQHGQKYTTKYIHMTKRLVKTGQTVHQGQTIGTVGSTGYSTAPHLHYEFLVNGVHRNPRTVELPKADPIPTNLKQEFLAQTRPLVAQLSSYGETQLARAQRGPLSAKKSSGHL